MWSPGRLWGEIWSSEHSGLTVPSHLPRWCGPCKILGPRLEKMVAKQHGKVVMAKVDIDDHTDLAIEYEVGVGKALPQGSQGGYAVTSK